MTEPTTGSTRPSPVRTGVRGRATRRRRPERPCLNCGDPTPGEFCPTCGQQKLEVLVSLRTMVLDLLDDEFLINRRLPHTLFALFFRPGFLTVEHVNGRIVRYLRPFKLYLVSSVVFFLLLSFFSLRALTGAEFGLGGMGVAEVDTVDIAAADSAIAEVRELLESPAIGGAVEATLQQTLRSLEQQRLAALTGIRQATAAEAGAGAGGVGPVTVAGDTVARDTAAAAVAPTATPRTVGDLMAAAGEGSSVTVNTGVAAVDSALLMRIGELQQMTPRAAIQRLVSNFLGYIPTVMFILLPVFALVLKLLYATRKRFYAEHFVFLLHVHSFVYLIFTVLLLTRGLFTLPNWLALTAFGWTALYIYLAMKRVYGQGWLVTGAKYWLLGFSYFVILTISVPVALMISLLL